MEEAIDEFLKYTKPYKKYGPMINLKIEHTLRVKDLCKEIAKSLNLSEEDIILVKMCGLLHDIGRFEQWKRYKTYADLKSIDHGVLGEEILKEKNLINKFTKENHDTIYHAVKYHNKYRIPNTLNEKNKLFLNITRDADKIDIMNVFIIENLNVKTNNTVMTDMVFNKLLNREIIKLKERKTKADALAVRIGFIFDINYKRTLEIIKERNYFNKMLDKQLEEVENEKLKEQIEILRKIGNEYIEEITKC